MKLNPDEKIESWDIIVKTTEGRELSFTSDLGFNLLAECITTSIDETLEENYPVTWIDEEDKSDESC